MKITTAILGFIICLFWISNFYPQEVNAAGSIIVSPFIIDRTAYPREQLKGFIILKTDANYKMNIYTFVNNFDPLLGRQEFLTLPDVDLSTSLANWININRGVIEAKPGKQETKIDFEIDVNLTAKPGVYHALIAFAEGPSREDAQSKLFSAPYITINLEVLDDINEKLQLDKFVSDKFFFTRSPISFSYKISNVGNRALIPHGEIRIFNRSGMELGATVANDQKKELEPNTSLIFLDSWSNVNKFGKLKARLYLEYGNNQSGTLQDTIFFWFLPNWFLFVLGTTLTSVIIVVFLLFRTR